MKQKENESRKMSFVQHPFGRRANSSISIINDDTLIVKSSYFSNRL